MSVATAVGFEMGYGEISSGLWLCLPIIRLEGDSRHFVARRIDWTSDTSEPNIGLTSIDDDELDALGATLPVGERRTIESGWALVVMGDEFAKDLEDSEIVCSDDVSVAPIPNETYAIGLATVESFERFRETICRNASMVFDKALSSNVEPDLGPKGRAALRLLRHSSYRRSDLAVRELAGAIVSGDLDLLRRLLTRYSIELEGESQESLETKAYGHIGLCKQTHALVPQTLDLNRAGRLSIHRDVNWEQTQAARLLSQVESHLVGIGRKQTLSGPRIEYTTIRTARNVSVLGKLGTVKVRAYSTEQALHWGGTMVREVNRRQTVKYVEKG